ncbi:MAG: phospholipid carrier-dependent glycosyltransferase [Candidatus Gottesmanbacteria bacterium]
MIKKFLTSWCLILLIFILASILRFNKLGEIPLSLSWDEVAQGYNAYALATTGKDEFGRAWPIDYLESFGDFKPVLYTYMTIMPVKIWGLNEFSTRFASAFFGSVTVLITYFLVLQLFFKSENKKTLALLTSLFLAISPWHINLSRAAFEANLGLFWIVLAMYLLLRGLNGQRLSFILSAFPFAAVFYTFNATRTFVPLFLISIAVILIKDWKILWKKGIIFGVVLFILLIPIIPHLFSPQAQLRFREVNIFSDLKPIKISNARIKTDNDIWWAKILHNRRLMFSLEFIKHYSDNLNLDFLFIHGDGNPKFSIQDVGQLYLFDLPLFFIGIVFLIKKYPPAAKIIFVWLLIGIVPAATARETPHALRILHTLPTWQIILAVGWYEAWLWLKFKKRGVIIIIVAILGLTGNFFWYIHNYYAHYPKEYAGQWEYGYKQAISYINRVYKQYDRIVITNNMGRPYIYFLYYNQYSPYKFRQTATIKRDTFGFVDVLGFDKYIFTNNFDLPAKPGQKTLFIVFPQDVPKTKAVKETINLPNGSTILNSYEQ